MRESITKARCKPRFYFFKPTDDMTKDRDTFIVQLTVGELIEILREKIHRFASINCLSVPKPTSYFTCI